MQYSPKSVKTPSSPDKTATTAASMLITLAAARLTLTSPVSSSPSSVFFLKVPAFVGIKRTLTGDFILKLIERFRLEVNKTDV